MTIINKLFGTIPGLTIDNDVDNVVKMTFNVKDGTTRSFTLTKAVITESFTRGEYLLAMVEPGTPTILMRVDSEPGMCEPDLAKFLVEYTQTPQHLIKQAIPLYVNEYDVLNRKLVAYILGTNKALVFVRGVSGEFNTTKH